MSKNTKIAILLANRIVEKAQDALSDLEREMTIQKWPADFRAIMWDAVADIASWRAEESRKNG